jgi:hypothetical protein
LKNYLDGFLGGVPEAFDILFNNASTTVFNQTLTTSQGTNVSQLVGITSGSPLFRLVIDLESNNLLIVSFNHLIKTHDLLDLLRMVRIQLQSILVTHHIPRHIH